MPRGAKSTKPSTIKKITDCNERVYVYARYCLQGVDINKDKVIARASLRQCYGDTFVDIGRITGKIVDTELIFDTTELHTQSIPAIKSMERVLADVLAWLATREDTYKPIAVAVKVTNPEDASTDDDDDEAEDVSNVKQVLVIPMTKASKLVGAKIGKDTVSSVSLFTLDGKWNIAFAINDGDCYVQAKTLFGFDVEVSEE